MMPGRDEEARAVCAWLRERALAISDALVDAILVSDMTVEDVRRLALNLSAYCDSDEIHAGIVPHMPEIAHLPPDVRREAHRIVSAAVAQAIEHHTPQGDTPS